MRKFSLSKRMQAIIDTVPECSVVADIGCDHGKILCSLLLSKKCRYGIGTDISEMCAIKTAELLEQCKISTGEVIVGDGLSTIEDRKVDCIILAGMGGREIDRILRE